MRPRLIIDNNPQRPATISILQAITAPTLAELLPADFTTLLTQLEDIPATSPTMPAIRPLMVRA